MGDKNMHSPQDQLLAEALDACMEEQLSFVPPEREIARMHQFSQEFQKRMEKLLQTGGRAPGKKLEKREFIYGFNRIAAGILLFLIVGGVGYLGLSMVEKGNSKKEAAYDEAAPAEEPDSSGMQEDLGEGPGHSQNQQTGADAPTGENGTDWGTKEETPEAEEPGSGQNIPDGEYLGRMLKPAGEERPGKDFGKQPADRPGCAGASGNHRKYGGLSYPLLCLHGFGGIYRRILVSPAAFGGTLGGGCKAYREPGAGNGPG